MTYGFDVQLGEVCHPGDRQQEPRFIRQWLHILQIGGDIVIESTEEPVLHRVFAFITGETSIDTLEVFRIEASVKTCFFISDIENPVRNFWIGLIRGIIKIDNLFLENVIDEFL